MEYDENYRDESDDVYRTAAAVFAALVIGAIGGVAAVMLAAWWFA